MIQQAVTAIPNESVLEEEVVPTAGVVISRRRRREDGGDDAESGSSTPHQRATLYDILHFVVWNGYGHEVGKAIGAAKVLDSAEMYESKYGLAQIVYQHRYYGLRTRLMFAAMKGNMARARLLLANRADVHVADDKALQLAISYAHADIARLLIEHGADVRMAFSYRPQCKKGVDVTAYRALIREQMMNADPTIDAGDILVIAVMNSDAALVSQNVDAGFTAWGEDGIAGWGEDGLAGVCGLLLDYVEQETGPEIVPTARALFAHPFFDFRGTLVMAGNVARNNAEGIVWVRELSVSPEAAANVDELLWAACCAGLVDVVQACLERGGDPNIDASGWHPPSSSAIIMAARSGRRDVVEILAQRKDIDLDWALVAAARIGSLDLCTYLLGQSADPSWFCQVSNESAVEYSIDEGSIEILHLLLKYSSARRSARRRHTLWKSAIDFSRSNANAIVGILLEKKISPKIGDLCYAAERGKRDIVRDILAAEVEGVNVHSSVTQCGQWSPEFSSFTPLLSACYGLQITCVNPASESDYLSIVRILCDAGANLEARIDDVTLHRVVRYKYGGGFTPLLLASRAGSATVVDELLTRGADINGRCANGQTALFYAREQGHDIIAQTLFARGATL